MTITIDQFVSREVHYCVSALISEIAGTLESPLGEQAMELASPIPDYEEAAIQDGWKLCETGEASFSNDAANDVSNAEDWEALCEEQFLDPYEREVYEHWIVSDWLADRLAEQGEKVDKDFCGLTVWARTTTGQGIASDSVIERIYADMIAA